MKNKHKINPKSKFYENNKVRVREKAVGWIAIGNIFAQMQYLLGDNGENRKGRRKNKNENCRF